MMSSGREGRMEQAIHCCLSLILLKPDFAACNKVYSALEDTNIITLFARNK